MRLSHSSLVLLTIILFCALPCAGLASDAADVEFSKLPLSFIENQGQKDPAVLFHVEAADRSIYFTPDGVIFSSPGQDGDPIAVSMAVLGYRHDAAVEGVTPLPGKANFFMGNDPESWITDVPTYAGVAYREVIPGVDLLFGGTEGTLKREFILSPGVDPEGLVLQYQGQTTIEKEADGSLNVVIPGGSLKEAAPVAYQVIGGIQKDVACSYRILGDGLVGFTVGPYNPNYALVIDPYWTIPRITGERTRTGACGGGRRGRERLCDRVHEIDQYPPPPVAGGPGTPGREFRCVCGEALP